MKKPLFFFCCFSFDILALYIHNKYSSKYGIGADLGNMGVGSGNSYTLSNPFGKVIGGGAHTHSVTTSASTTGAKGSGSAMSTLNNYKSVYILERIA